MIKRLLLLTLLFGWSCSIIAQKKTMQYDTEWKKVDDLWLRKGQPESALSLVKTIYAEATREANGVQQVKALLYMGKLTTVNTEDGDIAQISFLEKQLPGAKEPVISLLHSMLARTYGQYLLEHRWELQDRTATNDASADIATWTIPQFQEKIHQHFAASLQDPEYLKTQSLDAFDPLILKGRYRNSDAKTDIAPGIRALRPTLYDLLAHLALNFYAEDNAFSGPRPFFGAGGAAGKPRFYTDQPAPDFSLDPQLFAPARDFAGHRFALADSSSAEARAILLLQDLTRFHLKDAAPDALIDLECIRLQFAERIALGEEKAQRFTDALQALEKAYPKAPAIAQVAFTRAQTAYQQVSQEKRERPHTPVQTASSSGKDEDTSPLRNLPAVAAECRRIMQQFPATEGALNAERLLQDIEQKSFSLRVERVNSPDKPFRMRVAYRNIDMLHYRILPVTEAMKTNNRWEEKFWSMLRAQPSIRTTPQHLPRQTDLWEHSVELKVDGLAPGAYAILASPDREFSDEGLPMAVVYFHVSDIAYFHQDRHFFVIDRETGKPLANADVRVMHQLYDNATRKYNVVQAAQLSSSKDGYVQLPPRLDGQGGEQVRLDIRYGKDRLYLDEGAYYYGYRAAPGPDNDRAAYEKENRRVFLFTDRGIYRPGQNVFVKGIVMTRDFETRRYKIIPDAVTKLFLSDTEGEKIDSVEVRSNAFGSYSAEFRLPVGVMTGSFGIQDETFNGAEQINVEEYKRPSFYVQPDPVSGAFRIRDSIQVRGAAIAYAGNMRNDASVRYRITRRASFPYPWLRGYFPNRPPVEIAHGETSTDAQGRYVLRFPALPDPAIDPKSLPVFHYEVSVDITDGSGETRSAFHTVALGYHTLQLELAVPDKGIVRAQEDAVLQVSARNLSGEPLDQQVRVSVMPVQSPSRLIRPRLWPAPDTFVLSESEFLKAFPHDEYRAESQKENWTRGKSIWEQTDSIKGGRSSLRIAMKGQPAGWYVIVAQGTDSFGQSIQAETWYYHQADVRMGPAEPLYLQAAVLPPHLPSAPDLARAKPDRSRKAKASRAKPVIDPGLSSPAGDTVVPAAMRRYHQPGDQATIRIGTTVSELWVFRHLRRAGEKPLPQDGKISDPRKTLAMETPGYPFDLFPLKAGYTDQTLPVTEADYGGLGASYITIQHNRIFTAEAGIAVPWTIKELDVSLATFRQKLEPGSQESWTVRISGKGGEKWAAEILASMYDASLDQFRYHAWVMPGIHPNFPSNLLGRGFAEEEGIAGSWLGLNNFHATGSINRDQPRKAIASIDKQYDALIWEQPHVAFRMNTLERTARPAAAPMADAAAEGLMDSAAVAVDKASADKMEEDGAWDEGGTRKKSLTGAVSVVTTVDAPPAQRLRTDFRETAFFFPQLHTDSTGSVSFTFTMPDALTSWKWQVLAHTKDLALGYAVQQIITQKELMVQPNAPRFLREGDQLVFPARITNMGDKEVSGQAMLEILDAETGQVVDGLFNNLFPTQYFTAAPKQGTVVNFPLQIPGNFSKPVTYRIKATTAAYSDGEEQVLPVLSNRILLTESMPFFLKGPGTHAYRFDALEQSARRPSLTHHALTLEISTNPAWYAVQSLPYLTGYPYDCAEQVFNRFYGNALAGYIARSKPSIQAFFQQWNTKDAQGKKSLLSALEKNPELKSILLQETPWALDAKQQTDQMQEIARLFDAARIETDLQAALAKLENAQTANGGFAWFAGGPDSRYITQYMLTGIGKLRKTGAVPANLQARLDAIAQKSLGYMHARVAEDYAKLKASKADLSQQVPDPLQVQYLYAISFFRDMPTEARQLPVINYYRKQAAALWLKQSRMEQGMIALALWRGGDGKTPLAILQSLRQNAVKSATLGMYWKRGQNPWYWQESSLETQALMIEAFTEITQDENAIAQMKQWLITQKQTTHWESTRATADACYALLIRGSDWLSSNLRASITLGGKDMDAGKHDPSVESGTGYREIVIPGSAVTPEMGDMRVTLSDPSGKSTGAPAWGAAYWQYFEPLDMVRNAGGPLSVQKKLYRQTLTDKGPVLAAIEEGASFQVGDKLVVRLEIRADRDMEFVHLKDLRASGTEPVHVLSGYTWQGALGYYQSTRDAATHFFFDRINRGTYVFEYPVFVAQEGSFSTGPAILQCMYAPEFTAHSQGYRIKVRGK